MLYCSGGLRICFIVQRFRIIYCTWVQNVLLFRGSECSILPGFRMLYCSGVQNVLLFRGSECFIVLGFRMLYCSGGSECFIVQGFRMVYCLEIQNNLLYLGSECCIVQGFRMFYCSGVLNIVLFRGPGWTAITCETELKKGEYLNLAKLILTVADPSVNIVCLAARHIRQADLH